VLDAKLDLKTRRSRRAIANEEMALEPATQAIMIPLLHGYHSV
jgi:hypothetical protein